MKNIALGIVSIENCEVGNCVDIKMLDTTNKATIVEKPFYDTKKK